MSLTFVFIGAGNLATQLSLSFKKKGFEILQVFSRTEHSAAALAKKLECSFTVFPEKIIDTADIYFVALTDAAFEEVLPKINFRNKLVVHCSGSLPLSAIEKYSKSTGVFYPLQTFSKQREVNFEKIPVFVEGSSVESEKILLNLGEVIAGNVQLLNSEKRKVLHIAAVFASNFVNHFYTIASILLKNNEIPFEVLKPLILETAKKVQKIDPEQAQTGPAVRFDENIVSKHINSLENYPEYQKLYTSISKSIFEHHQKLKE